MHLRVQPISSSPRDVRVLRSVKRVACHIPRAIWKYTPRDIKYTSAKLRNPVKRGIKKGRCHGNSIWGSVVSEYKNVRFSKKEIPALAASAVAIAPIPSPIPIFPFVYVIGKIMYKAPAIVKGVVSVSKNTISHLK